MTIPKKYRDRVYEVTVYEGGDEFDQTTYEVNFNDGWGVPGEGTLIYCETRAEALRVMAEAVFDPQRFNDDY